MTDIFEYLTSELRPRAVTSDQGLYERQESQAAFSLPIIHTPFDPSRAGHWKDRGHILDFRAVVGGGDLLDLGPGDGWPSLLVAPHARSVTGVDASGRRVQVCQENARRLGISNYRGVQVKAGEPLPFPNESFDGVTAAHSLEQTPDPRATLAELYRVLKPGGRLRLLYEGLSPYQGELVQEVWAWESSAGVTQLLFCDRRIAEERALYYGLQVESSLRRVRQTVCGGAEIDLSTLTVAGLERIRSRMTDAVCWTLLHPSCRTWARWMREVGFRSAAATHDGGSFAAAIFSQVPRPDRPTDLAGVDRLLTPAVAALVQLEAPCDLESPITATK